MAKLTLTTPVNGGDLLPSVTEARVFEAQPDYARGVVRAVIVYGTEVDGKFVQSPINPPGGQQIVADLNAYADVRAAWSNFERTLLRRGATEGLFPPGVDGE